MVEVLYYAIPFFVLLLVVEAISFRHYHEDDLVGYELNDTRTSISMGLGNVTINVAWKLAVVTIYAARYELTPFRLDSHDWWVWIAVFLADDLAYYWFHRISHVSRFLAQSWSLIYQFGLHTERVGRLSRPVEAVFNTPSHHRVHHGANEQYLDRNYAGILIVWDRIFGTFIPESERVRYGLTKNVETFNPMGVAFGEYAALMRDLRAARGWRLRAQIALRGPGWRP
jgi:sterol desaturase/sphingolipid hydroxylase (fatty acid hydroxylase superfamily)